SERLRVPKRSPRVAPAGATNRRDCGMASGHPVRFGVGPLQLETQTWPGSICAEDAARRAGRAVEEHLFDSHVVVEILDVLDVWNRQTRGDVERRRRVGRERNVPRFGEGGRLQESGDAA